MGVGEEGGRGGGCRPHHYATVCVCGAKHWRVAKNIFDLTWNFDWVRECPNWKKLWHYFGLASCHWGKKYSCASCQQKLQSLKWKIGAKIVLHWGIWTAFRNELDKIAIVGVALSRRRPTGAEFPMLKQFFTFFQKNTHF